MPTIRGGENPDDLDRRVLEEFARSGDDEAATYARETLERLDDDAERVKEIRESQGRSW